MSVVEKNTSDAIVQQTFTDIQLLAGSKIAATTLAVKQAVLTKITNSTSVNLFKFIEEHTIIYNSLFNDVDTRIQKFFQKIMGAINEELAKVPTLSNSFRMIAILTKNQDIQNIIVKPIALPFVKDLIVDLDKIKTSIVDDIISS